ncbi:MAG TPA: response regulator [Flavisolibacter sp.]|jgi:CheY-like chemotaxis protein|nr:response regulator [Flavisolibacter sp.]
MSLKHQILIVDDDADDREIIRDAFTSAIEDQHYIFLENGDRLLDYLQQNPEPAPSLILLDLNMPGKDGRETLKELKSNREFHHIPTIVFTTSSSHRDKKISYDLGANCFITKPDTFNKLVELAKSIGKLWLL